MLGQIWSALTGKSQATQGVMGVQLDPIVKYRLALYLTTTTADGTAAANRSVSFRKLTTTDTK